MFVSSTFVVPNLLTNWLISETLSTLTPEILTEEAALTSASRLPIKLDKLSLKV